MAQTPRTLLRYSSTSDFIGRLEIGAGWRSASGVRAWLAGGGAPRITGKTEGSKDTGRRARRTRRVLDDGEGRIGQRGLIVGHYGIAVDVRLESGELLTLRVRRDSGHVVGDDVEIVAGGLDSLPAHGVLKRRDSRDHLRAVAANLDVLGIVVAPVPETPVGFVDRACVGALAAGIEPILVVNKADLPDARETYEALKASHGGEVPIFMVSAEDHQGLDALSRLFAEGRRGAFVGTSGVGKSSLLNALCPDLELDVGEINETSGLGRHVTTNATLHRLPDGGELVDTPGFRDFGPVEITALEFSQGYPGFRPFLDPGCRFRDCRHVSEPACAVQSALADGRLSRDRYDVYCSILEELESQQRRRRSRV